MGNITEKISISGWVNVDDALIAAVPTYQPAGKARSVTFLNNNAAAATLHFTDSGTQPANATDGLPIGTTAASAPSSSFTAENVDLNGIWINTGAAQDIIIAVIGL